MPTFAGVGWSESTDTTVAAREAAAQAIEKCGGTPDLLLIFATSRHEADAVHAGLRAAAGPTPRIVGGSAIGVLTNSKLGYDGYQLGVAAVRWGNVQASLLRVGPLAGREAEVGDELGRRIAASAAADPQLLLMYDSMDQRGAQPRMNMATPLLAAMQRHFPAPLPQLAGLGQCGDTPRDRVSQWFDDRVEGQTAQALVLSGDIRFDVAVMHGCRPAGAYHTVTKSDGPVLLEIDGRPALDVVGEWLGPEGKKSPQDYRFFVTLGVNKGDPWGEYNADDYANRLCCGIDEERGGLVMFEPDLVPGTQIQLMRRSVDFGYIETRTRELLNGLEGRRPILALYFDCAGRASAYCGSEGEEAAEVQRVMGDIPLLGVYCGVEVARVGGDWQPLDWSGVLCVWSEAS